MMSSRDSEKDVAVGTASPVHDVVYNVDAQPVTHEKDPFAIGEGEVQFRTQGWISTSMFMLKMTFSNGVLSIPAAFYVLGLINGIVMIVIFGAINTYMAFIMGRFKVAHPSIHSLPDAVTVMCRDWKISPKITNVCLWITEAIYLFTWILATGINMLGFAISLNAVTEHATCSVVFATVAYVIIASVSSIRRMSHLAWLTWVGLVTVFIAVLIVTIAVSRLDRPAAAPKTGPFDLGFSALPAATTTFTSGLSAVLNIFVSSGNTPGFIPVISEMRNPRDFNKSLLVCMLFINTSYLAFATVVYYYCGKWVSSPALGSAGPLIKKIAYGIAMPGLIAGAMTINHMAGKSLFVKLLRNSRHLTANTKTHWAVWLSCTFGVGFLGWLLAEAIPFFGELLSLIGCLCFGTVSIIIPTMMWFSLDKGSLRGSARSKSTWILHCGLLAVGLFVTIVGTYAVIVTIVGNFKSTNFGGSFSCTDNSNTVAGG